MISPAIRAIYYINLKSTSHEDIRNFLINDIDAAQEFYNIGFARSGTMDVIPITRAIVRELVLRAKNDGS